MSRALVWLLSKDAGGDAGATQAGGARRGGFISAGATRGRALVWLLLLLAAPAWAASAWTIPVGESAGPPPLDPLDAAWTGAPAAAVPLYPQATTAGGLSRAAESLRFSAYESGVPLAGASPLLQEARVLRGGGKLALRLAWPDATADLADAKATDRFADAAAVQFAPAEPAGPGCAPVGAGLPAIARPEIAGKPAPTAAPTCRAGTLPYVGMGEPGRPVRVWLWRAGRPAEGLAAQGFGSLSQQPNESVETQARRTATGWVVVLRGELNATDMAAGAIAFAAWDGAEDGRAGRKRLSAWRALTKPGVEPDARLLEEMRVTGDPARGARLYTEHGCAACHAPGVWIGPDLTHAGGIHWPGYLRRAIREPAAFLVPGYAAIMPALPLRPEEVDDLVAYLLTLH